MNVFNQEDFQNMDSKNKNEEYISKKIITLLNANFAEINNRLTLDNSNQFDDQDNNINSLAIYNAYRKYVSLKENPQWLTNDKIIRISPIGLNYLVPLFNCSCNKLIMGKEFDIELPLKERTFIKAYKELNSDNKNKIDNLLEKAKLNFTYTFIHKPEALGARLSDYDEYLKELMYLRFIDLADLRGVSLVELVSSSVIGRKYETFQLMLAQHSCNFILSRMFFEALTKNCSLDYLCCIDYTPYNQIYYTDENGTKVYLSDEEKKVLSLYLYAEEKKNDILAETFILSKI